MAETSFSLWNYSQRASVDPEKIFCKADSHTPTLVIPIRLDLIPLHKTKKFVLIGGEFSLKVDFGKILSKTIAIRYHEVLRETYDCINVEFELDEEKLHAIERQRKEGVVLSINFKFNIGLYEEIIMGYDERKEPIIKRFVEQFYTSDSNNNLEIRITQSQWVNQLLPNLGYKQYRLIELPSFNDVIPESYQKSINELEESIKYFKLCDWDKVVAHCRSAIDPIKADLPILKELIESKSEYKWFKTLNEKTYDWLKESIDSTISISSKTHHPPSMGHFTRNEAQIVLMITTSLVAYAGQLKNS